MRLTVKVPVPRAVSLFIPRLPSNRVVPPVKLLAPPRARVPCQQMYSMSLPAPLMTPFRARSRRR